MKVELLKVIVLMKGFRGHKELDRYQGDLQILELLQVAEIDSEGEVIHSAMIVEYKPIIIIDALKKKV